MTEPMDYKAARRRGERACLGAFQDMESVILTYKNEAIALRSRLAAVEKKNLLLEVRVRELEHQLKQSP